MGAEEDGLDVVLEVFFLMLHTCHLVISLLLACPEARGQGGPAMQQPCARILCSVKEEAGDEPLLSASAPRH
jgi:hypothetical protein